MRSPERRFLRFIPILLFLLLPSCSTIPKFPAYGKLADQHILTTVDSELAKYYLQHYLTNDRTNAEYDKEIDHALAEWDGRPLDSKSLKALTKTFSTDFVTLYFVSRIYQDPVNRKAQQAFHSHLAALRKNGPEEVRRIAAKLAPYLVAFAPGYAYRKDPTTGADFARQRWIMSRAGIKTFLIETDELATVERNASILAYTLTELQREHEKIILVSTSKAGPEVALAIGKLLGSDESHHVKAWISIGGMLRGTPSADQALKWPRSWFARIAFAFKGLSPDVIENLSTKKRKEVFTQLQFPHHILLVQYVGVPLSGHIGKHIEGRYNDLKPLGPNDGLTLLADEIIGGGIVITDIGLDHYYRDPEIDSKTFALTRLVLDLLEEREQQRPCTQLRILGYSMRLRWKVYSA